MKHYDVDRLKDDLDCRVIVEREIGPPIRRGSQAWSWQCPFHHGRKDSFSVWHSGWKCWADCQAGGDVITFIMQLHAMNFAEACEYLGAETSNTSPSLKPIRPYYSRAIRSDTTPPPTDWQLAATEIVERAEQDLWNDVGKPARDYLFGRGLTEETIKSARLGYVPGDPDGWISAYGLNIPSGITIPSFVNGDLWQVRVRRSPRGTGSKYLSIGGGRLLGSLFLGDVIQLGKPIVIVEGEFDCLILKQLSDDFSPVALSSASNTLSPHWFPKMMTAPFILIRMDDDPAGRQCVERHQNISSAFKSISMPDGYKDVNDLYLGDSDLAQFWINNWIDAFHHFDDHKSESLLFASGELGGVIQDE